MHIQHAHSHTHSKANKWINRHTHILSHIPKHTGNQCCSCKKIVNVKRHKWITLMVWLTVVFNIMISNPQKIDYITTSLFTWWKKTYYSAVLGEKNEPWKKIIQFWCKLSNREMHQSCNMVTETHSLHVFYT